MFDNATPMHEGLERLKSNNKIIACACLRARPFVIVCTSPLAQQGALSSRNQRLLLIIF